MNGRVSKYTGYTSAYWIKVFDCEVKWLLSEHDKRSAFYIKGRNIWKTNFPRSLPTTSDRAMILFNGALLLQGNEDIGFRINGLGLH